jgi:hypothetical protein
MRQTTFNAGSPGGAPLRRAVLALVMAGIVVAAAACGGSPASPPAPGTTQNAGSGGGSGPVTRPGGSASGGPGDRSAGATYSLAFASCMRAHGVPKFPDPDHSAAILTPGSGADPGSAAYQAALNGPCRSLAPAAWVSSGTVGGS